MDGGWRIGDTVAIVVRREDGRVVAVAGPVEHPQRPQRLLRDRKRWRAVAEHRLPAELLEQRARARDLRSEEHTSELQSRLHLVCRLLLEKKKNKDKEG